MEILDLAALLEPIPGDNPAGADPREDFSTNALYYRLRDARNEARVAERQADAAEADDAPPPAQWGPVSRLAVELIATQAKDLEAASWLCEALLRTHGLAGMAEGFRLMAELVDTWWDELHPLPDDEGLPRRVAPVAGLNGEGADGTLIQPLRKVPLFELPNGRMVALWQYEQSAELATVVDEDRRGQRLSAGVIPFDHIEAVARAAMPALRRLRSEAREAVAAWQALETTLDERAGSDAPPMRRVGDLLDEIVGLGERYGGPEDVETASEEAPAGETATSIAASPGRGRIATREDAFRVLEEIAAFFHSTEPHSPLAYTLREAVRRGRLTWPELLEEIVPDTDSRAAILNSLGIRPPTSME
jgi:type VI secretion system protein ImpA